MNMFQSNIMIFRTNTRVSDSNRPYIIKTAYLITYILLLFDYIYYYCYYDMSIFNKITYIRY